MKKICSKCKEGKETGQFYKRSNTKDGLYPHCRACHLAYTSNWGKLNPEKKREYSKDYYWKNAEQQRLFRREYHEVNKEIENRKGKRSAHKRWKDCIEGLGGFCVCCNEERISMLEIDHVKGFGNQHRKEMGGSAGVYCDIIKRGFPKDEYQVLCANCNQSKRRNGGACEHQTEVTAAKFKQHGIIYNRGLAQDFGLG